MQRVSASVLAVTSVVAFGAWAQPANPAPEWAYPANPPPVQFDATVPKTLPGSSRSYTQAQIENDFAPPD